MALVTVHRSPSPSGDCRETRGLDLSSVDGDGDNSLKAIPKTFSFSENYLTVKGAALILSQTDCIRIKTAPCETTGGDIQAHLQMMLYLLRVQDKLKLAVKLENRNSSTAAERTSDHKLDSSGVHAQAYCRYMALVSCQNELSSTGNKQDEASVILGIDIHDSKATIGLVLPVWGDCSLCLDGDGGFNVATNARLHNFKPVSVQAMWAALQCLIKARDIASRDKHIPNQFLNSWINFYSGLINSDTSFLCEWHATLDSSPKEGELLSLGDSALRSEDGQLEKMIRTKLKQVMMTVDLEEVTSKYLREELEEEMKISLTSWKRFIDDEMIIIMRQMDSPSEIFPYLYLGSEWNASNLEELRANNIGYILNVTREIANFYPETFEYYNVRIYDEENSDLLIHWENTHKFISKARDNSSKVLVHCKMGVSRSASTVIAFVMKEMKIGLEETMKYVKSKRSCIQPNQGFRKQLEIYEGILDASKQRHSHLWKSSSSTDLQESLSISHGLRPTSVNTDSVVGTSTSSSPSLSPSSACNEPNHQRKHDKEINTELSQMGDETMEMPSFAKETINEAAQNANQNHSLTLSSFKDLGKRSGSSFLSPENVTFYSGQNDSSEVLPSLTKSKSSAASSPMSNSEKTFSSRKVHDNMSRNLMGNCGNTATFTGARSLLSLFKMSKDGTKSNRSRTATFSRSRSASPKYHASIRCINQNEKVSIRKEGICEHMTLAETFKDAPKSMQFSLTPQSLKKTESFSLRVRPDNFWIREISPIDGNHPADHRHLVMCDHFQEDFPETNYYGRPLTNNIAPGKVMKTKCEIETRERTLSHSAHHQKEGDFASSGGLDLTPHVQRSSSWRIDRSKTKTEEGERRKTCPPLGTNKSDSTADYTSCPHHSKLSNLNDTVEHSRSSSKISSFWNCRHMSIPDCSDFLNDWTFYKLGSDVFKLGSGIVSKAKKEFEDLSCQESSSQLQLPSCPTIIVNEQTETSRNPTESHVTRISKSSSLSSPPFSVSSTAYCPSDELSKCLPSLRSSKPTKVFPNCKRSLMFDDSSISLDRSLSGTDINLDFFGGKSGNLFPALRPRLPDHLPMSFPKSRDMTVSDVIDNTSNENTVQAAVHIKSISKFQKAYLVPVDESFSLATSSQTEAKALCQSKLNRQTSLVCDTSNKLESQVAADLKSVSSLYFRLKSSNNEETGGLNNEDKYGELSKPTVVSPDKYKYFQRSRSLRTDGQWHPNQFSKEDGVSSSGVNLTQSPEPLKAIYQRNQKTFQSALVVVPLSTESFKSAGHVKNETKILKRPSDLGTCTSARLSHCQDTLLTQSSQENALPPNEKSSIKISGMHPSSDLPNSKSGSTAASIQKSFCHFSIMPSPSDPRDLQNVAPVLCKCVKENLSETNSDNSYITGDNCSNSCSKPTTPTYHVDQSLLCN